MNEIKKYWQGLQERERLILMGGGLVVALIMFYFLLWRPWHHAINVMETSIQPLRQNLVWIRQQSDNLKANGGNASSRAVKGANQSLISIVEQSSKRAKVNKAIQQIVPANNGTEVRVVLEGVNFNQWVRWIDDLFKQYGVDIKQISAERDEDKPNIAEIRVTFMR